MNTDKVSIIVPCYNQALFLPETLDSVLAQTYPNWECIIVNDGSQDNTDEIAKQYQKKDSRFLYLSKKNEGLAIARNIGISNTTGEFILPLDADDLIAPHYLEKAIDQFTLHPETKLVYCQADKFGAINEPWYLEEFNYDRFIWDNCIFCAAIFKRVDYNRTGGYNPNMAYGLEDWDFWLSLINKDDVVCQLDEVLFHYRIKTISMTTELSKHNYEKMLIQICSNHPSIYDPYKEQVVLYQYRIRELTKDNHFLERAVNTRAHRLGLVLLKPISSLKKLFKA